MIIFIEIYYSKMKKVRSLLILSFWVYIVLSIICSPEISGQEVICNYCKAVITGNYLIVDGKYYHPEHFLCAKCGKPISGSYKVENGKYYHPDCSAIETGLICAYCNKVITGDYITSKGKVYHPECYNNNVVPQCSVCLQPLSGEYKIDVYGNKFHAYHASEFNKCDNCGRLICPELTGGGISYGDGRHICNICYKKAVFTERDINDLLDKVMNKLNDLGFDLKSDNISIQGVNLNELKRVSGTDTFSELEGFCSSDASSETINGILQRKTFTSKIYVLNGIPAINLEAIIAHELMHAWMFQNTKNEQSSEVCEGSCNYIAYLYLLASSDPEVQYILKRMDKNPDIVYGGGYLKIKERFGGKPLSALMDYLKK
jgi:hypothetical protein